VARIVRRKYITPHRGLRRLTFRREALLRGAAVALLVDALLLWQGSQVLAGHARVVEALLRLAGVSWEKGKELTLLPGVSVGLLRTSYLDYQSHPLYPWYCFAAATMLVALAVRFCPAPLRQLLWVVPFSLGVTLFYLVAVSPAVPYNPEDFATIWYRGETYLWLLLPWIFAVSFFAWSIPWRFKATWLALLMLYSFLWSAIRLATALATFHYLGSLWMPLFYFVFGFLADFLYIVAFYSLAVDRAAAFLGKQQEAWR
jgi:hypothetical protein